MKSSRADNIFQNTWSAVAASPSLASHEKCRNISPGHKIPRTEYRTEITENRTKITKTEVFGSMFGSEFLGTELPR